MAIEDLLNRPQVPLDREGMARLIQGRRVLVTGGGPVGLLAALMGKQRDYEVYVLDHHKDGPKPQLVRDLGAHNPGDATHIEFGRDETDRRG